MVSPLLKPNQLLAVLKAWNEKFAERARFAFRVLLAGHAPPFRLEGGRHQHFSDCKCTVHE